MERRAFTLGAALGFSGIMALAIGLGIPSGPGVEAASTPPQLAAPAQAVPATATSSVPYLFPDESSVEGAAPFSASLRLQADGTYCAINCPDEGYE